MKMEEIIITMREKRQRIIDLKNRFGMNKKQVITLERIWALYEKIDRISHLTDPELWLSRMDRANQLATRVGI